MSNSTTAVKPADHLNVLIDALETPPKLLNTFITPAEHFFVCSAVSPPRIDADTWSMQIHGDAVEQTVRITFDNLLQMPTHTVISCLECAGSGRALFNLVHGKTPESDELNMTPWLFGGAGNAMWTGVKLRDVLDLAGVKANALDVNTKGLDKEAAEGGVSRPIPIEKALDPDTILAYMMNGEMLLPDHGYPVRLIVPGWIGSNSVKWVGSIEVSSEKIWVDRNIKHYVMMGDEWESEKEGNALGGPITTQNIKSSINLEWNAILPAGKNLLRGIARSPHARIQKVEWSVSDADGNVVQSGEAKLLPPFLKYAWVHFEFAWNAALGEWVLRTRATDEAGNVQPEEIPFNLEGYLFNQVIPHPVVVVG